MAAKVTELPNVRSIQGEQQEDVAPVKASEEDVDLYVDRVSDEVLACRERGRHLFPTIRQAGIHFSEVDSDGLFIRRLTCTCCELAVKVEKWEGSRQRGRTRFHRIASTLEYRTGREGQTYLSPSGRGRMTPRQIGDSVASKALSGQSLTALRKAVTQTTKTPATEQKSDTSTTSSTAKTSRAAETRTTTKTTKPSKTRTTAKTGKPAKATKPTRKTSKAG